MSYPAFMRLGRALARVRRDGYTVLAATLAFLLLHPALAGTNTWTSNGPYGGQVTVLTVDPKVPNTMYAAGLSGIFRTTDGALTWTRASNGITDPSIASIAIDPVTTSTLYAGSIQGGHVVKSTDGGTTWTPLATGPTLVVALAIPAQTPTTIYAAQQQSGILKSTDSGATWNKVGVATLPSFPTFRNVVVDPANPSTLYAGETSKGVYKSTDGGTTWAAANTGFTTGSIIQVLKLAIDPQNPATLYAAANTSTSAGLFKSTNGGASWTQIFNDASSTIIVQSVAVDPQTSANVYFGTFSGTVMRSSDGGAHFTVVTTGLPKNGVNVIALDSKNPATVYAGTQNGIFASSNSGAAWTAASAGLALTTVTAVAADPLQPTTVYAGTSLSGIFKSLDGGDTWTPVTGLGATGNLSSAPYIASIVIDPTAPGTVYAGTQGTLGSQVLKSTNGGASWTASATGLPAFSSVSAIAIAPPAPASLFAATLGHGLWQSVDAGATWTQSDAVPPTAHVNDVSISVPRSSSSIKLAPADYSVVTGSDTGFTISLDHGKTWKRYEPVDFKTRFCIDLYYRAAILFGDAVDDVSVFLQCVSRDAIQIGDNTVYTANGYTLTFPASPPIAAGGSARTSFALPPPTATVPWAVPAECDPVTALALSPTSKTRDFYTGSTCGVFKGTNGGAQMNAMSDGLPANLPIIALAISPTGNELYAGARSGGVYRYTVSASPAAPVTVVEYYNATLDHYFITWVPAEQANLDAGNTPTKWTRTGESFKTYTAAQAGTSPVCRYYIPPAKGDSHFFGRGTTECNATGTKNPTFTLESPDFMQMFLPAAGVCPAGTVQIYRVFSNRTDANHRYMTSKAIRDQMVAKGWLVEGDGPDSVVMCAPG